MNRPFVKLMCESYYNDAKLKNSNIWSKKDDAVLELQIEINSLMETVKMEDEDLYFYLHKEYTESQSQKLIYSLLNEHMLEKYGDGNPYDRILTADEAISIINEDGGATAIGGMFAGAASALSMAGGIATGGLLIGGILTVIAILKWKQVSRLQWAALDGLNVINQKISAMIGDFTKAGRVKRAIFVNTVDDCWKKCGIKPEEISALVGFALKSQSFSSPEADKQADCLSSCYLNWTLSQIIVLCEGYVKCLQSTGERTGELTDLNIFLDRPAGSACSAYYDIIKKHHADYMDAIDIIFHDEPSLKENWKRRYHEALSLGLKSDRGSPRVGKDYDSGMRNDPRRKPDDSTPNRDQQKSYPQNRDHKKSYPPKQYTH